MRSHCHSLKHSYLCNMQLSVWCRMSLHDEMSLVYNMMCRENSWVGGSVTREGGQSVHCYCCCSAMELRVTGCSLLRVAKDTRTPRTIMWIVPAPKHFQEHALFRCNIVDWIQCFTIPFMWIARRCITSRSRSCTNSLAQLHKLTSCTVSVG